MFRPSFAADLGLPKVALTPQLTSGTGTLSEITGSAIDRMQLTSGQQGYQSAKFLLQTGLTSGTVSAFSLTGKIQHSTTGTDGWADLPGVQPAGADIETSAITGTNSSANVAADLAAAYQYIRLVVNGSVTGSTGGAVYVSASCFLGGAKVIPVS